MTSKYDEYLDKYKGIYTGGQKLTIIKDGEFAQSSTKEMYGDGLMFVKKVMPFAKHIVERKSRAITILDYGCGRALHTHMRNYNIAKNFKDLTIFELFQGMIQCYYCYDPAVRRYSVKPSPGTLFDLVAVPDVLEHVPEDNVGEVISDAASFLKQDGLFVATISGMPAYAHFLNKDGTAGENLHCTVKPLEWWVQLFHNVIPDQSFVIIYEDETLLDKIGINTNVCLYGYDSPHFKLDRKQFTNLYWVDK